MKRALLIENPAASRSTPKGVEAVLTTLRGAGWEASSVRTEGHGHAAALAADAAQRGTDVVAVYGGDGTIMQAVEGLYGTAAILAVVPGGTGNLLAGNLRIPRNPRKAARLIAEGTPRTIDLGRLETTEGSRFFAVGCGTGYDADMMAETTPGQKRRWGVGAYIGFIVRTAHRIRPAPVRIAVDGAAADYEAVSVVVANCAEALPPILKLGPDVAIDDGTLDVVVFRAHGVWGAARTVWDLLRQRESERARRIRGTRVRIETPTPQVVQADGDICGTTPLEATVVADALKVMVRRPHRR